MKNRTFYDDFSLVRKLTKFWFIHNNIHKKFMPQSKNVNQFLFVIDLFFISVKLSIDKINCFFLLN